MINIAVDNKHVYEFSFGFRSKNPNSEAYVMMVLWFVVCCCFWFLESGVYRAFASQHAYQPPPPSKTPGVEDTFHTDVCDVHVFGNMTTAKNPNLNPAGCLEPSGFVLVWLLSSSVKRHS
jgi:hypothetical protein